ncbi:hypothetical protein D3C75_669740 [compost metagenome]
MGPALMRINIIGKRVNVLCIGIVILQSNFHRNHIAGTFHVDGFLVQRFFFLVQILYILNNTAFVFEHIRDTGAFIQQRKLNALVKKGQFANACEQCRIFKNSRFSENLRIRKKRCCCAGLIRITDNLNIVLRSTASVFLLVSMAVALNGHYYLLGQCIYDGNTYAVQTAGNLITAAAEFTSGMQDSHYNFKRGFLQLHILADRNTPPVINYSNTVIFMNNHLNPVAKTCQRLIDTVIDNLPDQMMQTLGAGRADVHAGTLPDRFQPFKHLNLALIICRLIH